LTILLLLLAVGLFPSHASAVPQKESSGPLLGDPDTPEKPSSGVFKAADVPDKLTLDVSPMIRATHPTFSLRFSREYRDVLWMVALMRIRGF
jgi:hypothetical protein